MTVAVCSHCGADAAPGNAACRDCRLAPGEPPAAPSLPDDEQGEPEVAFELDDWPAADRVALGVALNREGIPWRWEPGPVLVVRELDEAVVEELLDEAEGGGAEWEERDGEGAEGEEADEAAQSAMGDLFLAADRLVHAPWNAELVAEVDRLGEAVEESAPPFGVEPEVWDHIASLADAVVDAADEGNDEAVEDAARSLRDYLRRYV